MRVIGPQIRNVIGGAALIAAITTAAAMPAGAQQRPRHPPSAAQPHNLPQPPEQLPRVHAHGKNLDFLFGALKAAPDKVSAKHVEARIWALWAATPSDTASLLMARVKTAAEQKDTARALKLLDAVVKIRPDYVEGWNRRATFYYIANDYTRALADIQRVLLLEPRHFGALTGLGMIMQELGDDRRALQAFRRALDINPYLENLNERIRVLGEKVEGRDI